MWAIVTVKIKRNPRHDPKSKHIGPCPINGVVFKSGICTDMTGSHHSYIAKGKDLEEITYYAERKFDHVTRIEPIDIKIGGVSG